MDCAWKRLGQLMNRNAFGNEFIHHKSHVVAIRS